MNQPRVDRVAESLNRDWLRGLILLVAIVITYSPVWRAGYIWDDDVVVTANPVIVGPLGLKEIWTTGAADICPLTLTTFWLEHELWGTAPFPYHFVNVLWHAISGVVLWRVLLSLRIPGAWFGAALWALHPVQVESVAWITEMKNTQSGSFFLLAILFFVKGTRDGWRMRQNYALTLLFSAMALASKSSTVILPGILCLCAWWIEGRLRWQNLVKMFPIFLMAMASGLVAVWTQSLHGAGNPHWVRNWPERWAQAGDAVWFYCGKLIWPHPLSMVYPMWQIDAGEWIAFLPLWAVIIVLLVFWFKRESWSRLYIFAWACFLVSLLPVVGLVNMMYLKQAPVADRFQYLASTWLLALVGAAGSQIVKARLQVILGALMLFTLDILTWQQASLYQSNETLWRHTLAWNPNSLSGYNNLGIALLNRGQRDEAIDCFRKAIAIDPDYAEAYGNLADALTQEGRLDEAIAQCRRALEINPNLDKAYFNLGSALDRKGRIEEALPEIQRSIELNPDFEPAHLNLAVVLSEKGNLDAAIAEYKRALELKPEDSLACNNLGSVLVKEGRIDEAIAQFQTAVALKPDFAEVHFNLGNAFAQKGQLDSAIAEYDTAIEIKADYVEAINSLGVAYGKKGEIAKAIAQFREVLRLSPDSQDAKSNLAKAQAMSAHPQ